VAVNKGENGGNYLERVAVSAFKWPAKPQKSAENRRIGSPDSRPANGRQADKKETLAAPSPQAFPILFGTVVSV